MPSQRDNKRITAFHNWVWAYAKYLNTGITRAGRMGTFVEVHHNGRSIRITAGPLNEMIAELMKKYGDLMQEKGVEVERKRIQQFVKTFLVSVEEDETA